MATSVTFSESRQRREQKEYKSGRRGWSVVMWNTLCQVWHSHCSLELSAAVVTCTRPAQDSLCLNEGGAREAPPFPEDYWERERGVFYGIATGEMPVSLTHTSLLTLTKVIVSHQGNQLINHGVIKCICCMPALCSTLESQSNANSWIH